MDARPSRLHLSAPRATEDDIAAVVAAMRSGWLAPTGPDLAEFEADLSTYLGVAHAVGLSSGTSGLQLGLKYLGVRPGDAVLIPTVTFAATAFAATHVAAKPVFVDVDPSFNLDPNLLASALEALRKSKTRVGAVLPVDLYGTPCDYGSLLPVCDEFGVPILEDAAEGLGAKWGSQHLGGFGRAGVLSFNGNKIITTSGGGMLVTNEEEFAQKVRFWSTQARDDAPWYEHSEIGYNYRLSNLLAALGRSQLKRVDAEVAKRRQIRDWYRSRLQIFDGIAVQSDPSWGKSNAWLTIVRFSEDLHPAAPTRVREFLDSHNIESRPIWKPMHQQPVFRGCKAFLNGHADALFRDGLCLPSGTSMDEAAVDRVSSLVIRALSN